jgi:hypothetical protein
MLEDAFNNLLRLKQVSATLKQGVTTVNVLVSPSSYSRSLSGPSNIEIEGEEFVISKRNLTAPLTEPRRGDRLVLSSGDFHSVKHVVPLYNVGGAVMGWRLRSG